MRLLTCILLATGLLFVMSGCSTDTPGSDNGSPVAGVTTPPGVPESKTAPPTNLVQIEYKGEGIDLWPYLTPNGEHPEDPVNLIFVGEADVLEIRAALMSLDGDRTAYGFPPVFPFNATWSEAMGGVQAAYVDGSGWSGSIVQLQLGAYGPVRIHLRLFQTAEPFDDDVWTVGGAHVEIQIPDTPEHQVIAWELAEQIVAVDLVRSGLLGAAPAQTQAINEAPGFRTIPPMIYNGIPDPLKVACGLPPGPASEPVPIPTDGHATILELAQEVPITKDSSSETLTIQFHQVIPKPFCATGPADMYMVDGPVSLKKTVQVGANERYVYHYQLSGMLTASPVGGDDLDDSFRVRIHDIQSGSILRNNAMVSANVQRIAPQEGGAELLMEWINIGTNGTDQFRHSEHCLTP